MKPNIFFQTYAIEDYYYEKTYTLTIVNAFDEIAIISPVNDERFNFDLTSQRNGIYFINLTDQANMVFDKVLKSD